MRYLRTIQAQKKPLREGRGRGKKMKDTFGRGYPPILRIETPLIPENIQAIEFNGVVIPTAGLCSVTLNIRKGHTVQMDLTYQASAMVIRCGQENLSQKP